MKNKKNFLYKLADAGAWLMEEKNDCAVKAVSIVARVDYFTTHALLKKHGRKDRQPTRSTTITWPALESLGMKMTKLKRIKQSNGSMYTPKTIGGKLKKGYYLCFVKGHVFAVVNGKVCDWTENRNHRIKMIYKVEKMRKIE